MKLSFQIENNKFTASIQLGDELLINVAGKITTSIKNIKQDAEKEIKKQKRLARRMLRGTLNEELLEMIKNGDFEDMVIYSGRQPNLRHAVLKALINNNTPITWVQWWIKHNGDAALLDRRIRS
jgi:hypothetical protein